MSCFHGGREAAERRRLKAESNDRNDGHFRLRALSVQLLVSKSEFVDDLPIARQIRALEVIQEAAALADHLQQPATAVMVLGMAAEMIGERVDACAEQCDLDLGRAEVRLMQLVFGSCGRLVVTHTLGIPCRLPGW